MKTNYSKILMSAVAIIFAIGGSFASHTSENRFIVTGYIIPIGATMCQAATTCDNVTNPVLCTVVYQGVTYTAFGKASPNDTTCPIALFKPLP